MIVCAVLQRVCGWVEMTQGQGQLDSWAWGASQDIGHLTHGTKLAESYFLHSSLPREILRVSDFPSFTCIFQYLYFSIPCIWRTNYCIFKDSSESEKLFTLDQFLCLISLGSCGAWDVTPNYWWNPKDMTKTWNKKLRFYTLFKKPTKNLYFRVSAIPLSEMRQGRKVRAE